jgi:hypothetical protein
MKILRRSLLMLLAVVFLIETWIWDAFAASGRWIAARIPFREFKAAVARLIQTLPPFVALVLFVIPALVVLPFKIAGLWLIASGHFLAGGAVFLAAKIAGVGVAAFLFELTRDKLMTMVWFAKLYATVMAWRDWAHRLVDPYMNEIKAQVRAIKALILRSTSGERGRLAKTVVRMRERIRRLRMQG